MSGIWLAIGHRRDQYASDMKRTVAVLAATASALLIIVAAAATFYAILPEPKPAELLTATGIGLLAGIAAYAVAGVIAAIDWLKNQSSGQTFLWLAGVLLALILGFWAGMLWVSSQSSAPMVSIQSLTWKGSSGEYAVEADVTGVGDLVVWSYASRLDGNSEVYPQAPCEPANENEFRCIGYAGRPEDDVQPFVVTVVVMTTDQSETVSALVEDEAGTVDEIREIPHAEGLQPLDSLASIRP